MPNLSHSQKLAVAGLVTFATLGGVATPAQAVFRKTVNLTCEYPLIGTLPVAAKISADIPASVPVGVETPPFAVTIEPVTGTNDETATSGWFFAQIIRAASLSGTITANATVQAPDLEQSVEFDANIGTYTVPATDQDLLLKATGTLPSLTFPRRGGATMTLDGLALNLRAVKANGLPVTGLPPVSEESDGDPTTFDAPCTIDPGQDRTLAEFAVGAPASPEEIPTKPGTPVASAITTTGATLVWGASTDTAGPTPGVVRYDVFEGSKKVGTTGGATTTLAVAGLAPGPHTLTVRAIDGDGNRSAASDPVTFTVETPPNTAPTRPGKPVARDLQVRSVLLEWEPSTDDDAGIRYAVSQDGTQITESETVWVVISDLAPGTEHCFTVVAIDRAGLRSAPSEETCFTTPLPTPTTTPHPSPSPRPAPGPGSLALTCAFPLVGALPVTAEIDAAVPAAVTVGATPAFDISANLVAGTNADTETSTWRALKIIQAASLSGTAHLRTTVDGGGLDALDARISLDIAKYVPPLTEQDLVIPAVGQVPPLRFTRVGNVDITVDSVSLNLNAVKANGMPVTGLPNDYGVEDSDGDVNSFDVPCTVDAGQDARLATTTVVAIGIPIPTPLPTPTPTSTPFVSYTPVPTPTPLATPKPPSTPRVTPPPAPTPTPPVGIPIRTPLPTPTPLVTPTVKPIPTGVPTPRPSPTPIPTPPVGSPRPTPKVTPTPSPRPTPVVGLPVPTPVPTSPPTGTFTYDLTGAATLKTLAKGTLPLKGSVAATLEGSSGKVTADLNLQPTKARLTALGFLPVTASIAFVTNGKTTGTLQGTTLQTTSNVRIKLPQVSVLGLPIAGGTTCQTRELSKIDLTSTPFSAAAGGTLAGTFAIGNLSGCGILNGLVSPLTAGSGNTITAKLTPSAAPTT